MNLRILTIILWGICYLYCYEIFPQISDNFSDGNLTANPPWAGELQNYTITGGRLVSNGPNLNSQNIYISTPNTLIADTEWNILVDLQFAPSSTNYTRIHLVSNSEKVNATTASGYYLQIGEANQDRINLYRKDVNNSVLLISSTGLCFTSTSANFSNVRIKITRDNAGLWNLYTDCLGGTNYVFQGSSLDATYSTTAYFGIQCVYATASRHNLFSFDDIFIGPLNTNTITAQNLAFKDIVINEIMADPNPSVGLPGVEYIELYNTTESIIDLTNFTMVDGKTNRKFSRPIEIGPKEYLVLCGSGSAKTLLESTIPGIKVYTLSGFGLTDTGEEISLLDAKDKLIDKVKYNLNWYKDTGKDNGGYSLEQINPYLKCSTPVNWMASSDISGGTPGFQNAVYNTIIHAPAPEINTIKVTTTSSIQLTFSQPMDTFSLKTGHYHIDNFSILHTTIAKSADTLSLYFNKDFITGQIYNISVNGVKSCLNQLVIEKISSFGKGKKPAPGEILINEIFADVNPQVTLPLGEFVELYNSSEKLIDLSNCTISDNSTIAGGKIPVSTILAPRSHLIVTSNTYKNLYKTYGNTVAVSGFPTINDAGDLIILKDPDGNELDKVNFSSDWYKDPVKKNGGWTLERIIPEKDCGKDNWIASLNPGGGTPGGRNSVYDQTPPAQGFRGVSVINSTEIKIGCSEVLDIPNQEASISFTGIGVSNFNFNTTQADTLTITFSSKIDSGKVYHVFLSGFKTCMGTELPFTSLSYFVGRTPKQYEVVINEIMADESPPKGLPEAEYVELYNNTHSLLDLSGCILTDGSSFSKFPKGSFIDPKGYLILCAASKSPLFIPYGKVLGLSNFPSLNNTGEKISLLNTYGMGITNVLYKDSWYKDQIKKEGGWSLEKVDPENYCGGENNWSASVDSRGGTPGKINSIYAINPDNEPPSLIKAIPVSADTLELYFNETIDSASASNAAFTISLNNTVTISKVNGDKIVALVNPQLIEKDKYTLIINTPFLIKDCAGNYISDKVETSFSLPESAEKGDIILNEILFNPKKGGVDFVEIYNNSKKEINLKNWKIGNDKNSNILFQDHFIIKARQYLAFTINKHNILNYYPKAVDTNIVNFNSMPSFNDDKGKVKIYDSQGIIMDEFDYDEKYHFKLIEDKEGVSLERISPFLPTNTPENWHSAASTVNFATPGYQNSQSNSPELETALPIKVNPVIFSPDEDGYLDFTTIQFNLALPGQMANITIFDLEGRIVKRIARNFLLSTSDFFKWDGTDDNGRKVGIGPYMIFADIFDLHGNTRNYKEKVVIAAKFD